MKLDRSYCTACHVPKCWADTQVISEELGMKLENVDLSQLGRAKKVSVSKVRAHLC